MGRVIPRSRRRIQKKPGTKRRSKFEVMFDATTFYIVGRAAFSSRAKKIVVNQNKAKGLVEDRRHILHYDEVLKPAIERVISRLYISEGGDKNRVALLVSKSLLKRGLKRLPKRADKIMERLVVEINSVPGNLVPDRADTNKAIEVVRGYLRKYIEQLSTAEFAEDSMGNNSARMKSYRDLARQTFVCDSSGGEITEERNRIHRQILGFIDGCGSPSDLWILVHDLVHSVTFDFSPNISRNATSKAVEWQKAMVRAEGLPPREQLEVLLSLLDS